MIGIYKVVSPSGKIYIGQSIDIDRRFYSYKKLNCKDQPALFNSLLKYGVDKHNFIVLEKCSISELNKRERFYQEKYNSIEKGLNCTYVKTSDKSGKHSNDTRRKISLSAMGNKYTLGYKHSEESKLKISKSNKGKRKGVVIPYKQRIQHSKAMLNGGNPNAVKVIDIENGEIYDTIKQASESVKMPATTLGNKLSGYRKNDTKFRYK